MVIYFYAEHIFQMLTFNFILALLWAPFHGKLAFIKHEEWPYNHLFYMAIARHTTESVHPDPDPDPDGLVL